MSEGTITHVSGVVVRLTQRDLVTIRQRCAWCGTLLVEYIRPPVIVQMESEPSQTTWEPYTLVRVDGPNIDPLQIGDLPPGLPDLPEDSCFHIDQAVTR